MTDRLVTARPGHTTDYLVRRVFPKRKLGAILRAAKIELHRVANHGSYGGASRVGLITQLAIRFLGKTQIGGDKARHFDITISQYRALCQLRLPGTRWSTVFAEIVRVSPKDRQSVAQTWLEASCSAWITSSGVYFSYKTGIFIRRVRHDPTDQTRFH